MDVRNVIQDDAIIPDSDLTVSGGATPAVTGRVVHVGDVVSPFSLFLKNEGNSTSLTVTYQIGFVDEADKGSDPTITWVTPADGGAIDDFAAVDINNNQKHASINLAVSEYYRFIVTNNDGGNTAKVSLYLVRQV